MSLPSGAEGDLPGRIELCAFLEPEVHVTEALVEEVAKLLQVLARYPQLAETFIAPMHTLSLRDPPISGSSVSGALFTVPGNFDQQRFCRCLEPAELVVGVVPLLGSEVALATQRGSEALLDLLESNGISNAFNPWRQAVV
jgi:hypothetical protein